MGDVNKIIADIRLMVISLDDLGVSPWREA
jgi:hypothetical protein